MTTVIEYKEEVELVTASKTVLAWLEDWFEVNNYSPTLREISRGTGIRLATVHTAIEILSDMALIKREPGMARTIRLPEKEGDE